MAAFELEDFICDHSSYNNMIVLVYQLFLFYLNTTGDRVNHPS